MKKKSGVVLAVIMLVVIWWWVSGQSSGSAEEGVLDVWLTWGDNPEPVQAFFDFYAAESGQRVRVRTGVTSEKIARAMGGPRSPDLVVLSSSDPVGALYDQGVVEPLNRWIETMGIDTDDIYPAPLAQCRTAAGVYACLPWGADVEALYWNKDLFEAAGLDPERPPQTMDELLAYAEVLTVRDGAGDLQQVGFIPAFPRSHIDLYAGMYGGDWAGREVGGLSLTSGAMSDALSWEAAFYDLYSADEIRSFVSAFTPYLGSRHAVFAGRRLSCRQCHRATSPREDKLPDFGFYSGQIAMMVDGQWQVGPNAIDRFGPDLNYGVVPFPAPEGHPERQGVSMIHGPVALLPANAADKGAAADLLAWMMRPDTVLGLTARFDLLPTSRRAGDDPAFGQSPELAVFLDLLAGPGAECVPTSLLSTELAAALDDVERDLFAGADVAALLGEAQKRLEAELPEAGR